VPRQIELLVTATHITISLLRAGEIDRIIAIRGSQPQNDTVGLRFPHCGGCSERLMAALVSLKVLLAEVWESNSRRGFLPGLIDAG
jgi:hypothetical protein